MTDTVHFSTQLRPHRSLSPNGFTWLIRALLLANLLVALPMITSWVPWPVAASRPRRRPGLRTCSDCNYLDARAQGETLTLTDRRAGGRAHRPRRRARRAPARRPLAADRAERLAAGPDLARQPRRDRPLPRRAPSASASRPSCRPRSRRCARLHATGTPGMTSRHPKSRRDVGQDPSRDGRAPPAW